MTEEQHDHELQERRRHDHDGTITARLERIERKLDEVVKRQEHQEAEIRCLQDWKIEMNVYLRQARWTLVVALGAMIASVVGVFVSWPH